MARYKTRFPVQGGGQYTNDWGAARATTGSHKGTDIFVPEGTPVVATEDGVITKMGPSKIGGNRIWVNGRFYYAHLQRFAKGMKQGVRVKAGQIIGYVGTTGDAKGTPPHLHFGYDPSGTHGANWQNPYTWLQRVESGGSVNQGAPVTDTEEPSVPDDAAPAQPYVSAPTPSRRPSVGPGMAGVAGVGLPGDVALEYQPRRRADTWRFLASDEFASPDTKLFAERASLLMEDEQDAA